MKKKAKEPLPDLACPRCGHADTVPLRNYGRPMVGEVSGTSRWRCLECKHRFDGPKVRRAAMIRWKRADDGFVESHDGRWRITPLYWGCVRPQVFELHRDGKRVASYCSTQREAKESAELLLSKSKPTG